MAATLPWFKFYIDDLQGTEAYRELTYEQRGIFIDLLCWQWRDGSIPADERQIARLLPFGNARCKLPSIRRVLRTLFMDAGVQGRVINGNLEEIRAETLEKSEKARRSAILQHRRTLSNRSATALRSPGDRSGIKIESQTEIKSKIKSSLRTAAQQRERETE